MLRFIKEKRLSSAVPMAALSIADGLAPLSSVQRCATAIVAHAMIRAAADRWGMSVLRGPRALPKAIIIDMLDDLVSAHSRLVGMLRSMSDRNITDRGFTGAIRQLRATEVLIVTYGVGFSEDAGTVARAAWQSLTLSRHHAKAAVEELRLYEKEYEVASVPMFRTRNGKLGDADLMRLGTTLPPFLQPQGRKGPKAAAHQQGRKQGQVAENK